MELAPQQIKLGAHKIAYRELGQGPRHVLFVHGWASSSRMWQSAMQALATDCDTHCWALDLLGFGDSDKPENGAYNIASWAALLADFGAAFSMEQPAVIAHSMGGMIALNLAAHHAALVNRIGLLNPVVTGRIHPHLDALGRSWAGSPLFRLAIRMWPLLLKPGITDPFGLRRRRSDAFARDSADWHKASGYAALHALRAIMTHDASAYLPSISQGAVFCSNCFLRLTFSRNRFRLSSAFLIMILISSTLNGLVM